MSSNKVEGLCAPTVTAVQRKVRGYIFYNTRLNEYYLKHGIGAVSNKENAYVYSMEEIKHYVNCCNGWGSKEDGKWLIVYE